MRNLIKYSWCLCALVLLLCAGNNELLAQKKGKKGKKGKQAVEEVKEAAKPAAEEPNVDTSEADALMNVASYSGQDSTNYSLYREYFKQKAYDDALPFWRKLYQSAPDVRKTPLINGEEMYEALLDVQVTGAVCKDGSTVDFAEGDRRSTAVCKEKDGFKEWAFTDKATLDAYRDTIYGIWDTRIKYFGEEGVITTKKARMTAKYYPEKSEEIFELRKLAVEQQAEEAAYDVAYSYFIAMLRKLKSKEIEKDAMISIYDQLSDVMSYNIENNESEKQVEKYQDRMDRMDRSMEKLLAAYDNQAAAAAAAASNAAAKNATDCPTIKEIYGGEFRSNPNDLNTVKRLYSKLKRAGCKSDPMYMEALLKLQELDATASRARLIGIQYQKSKDYNNAKSWYEKSLGLEGDNTKNASTYLKLAKIEYVQKNYPTARKHARKAIELRAGWGDPYLLIGDLYASSASKCSGDGLGGRSVFWVAVDMYRKAKDIDPGVTSKANDKINRISGSFPDKETIFMATGKTKGTGYTVGCWINQRTTIR